MSMWNEFLYGVCYYPEHWEASRRASDIARIADCGFNVVRMGEGAWGYWEAKEGEYRFELFDKTIDLCRKHGVKVIMGTPTYCAPAWVGAKYPEVLRWNFNRVPMGHGSRRNLNYTSAKYLELSDKLCGALAEHYRGEKQIIGWQLDNEFNCHMDVSYAPSDEAAFRVWLAEKYKTIEGLNKAWGTLFWSQQYDDWEQVHLPQPTATYANPSQLLDETRFISDCVVGFAARQAEILRAAQPKWKITHNALFTNIDGPKLMGVLDFFSQDQYPLFWNNYWPGFASNLIQARSLSFPYAVLEQQSGPGGQMEYLQRTPRPGEMRLWVWQGIAHGAKLMEYFRWRTCPYGSEQHWHGLLDQDDRDNRRVAEAKGVGKEIRSLPGAFFDAPVVRSVAVMRDYDNDANERRINTYTREGKQEAWGWLAVLGQRHISADMVWPGSDLAGYKMVIVPHFKMADKALVAKLEAFARGGGTVVLGAQSGLKDENCHIVERPLPGVFAKLAGLEIGEWTTLPVKEGRGAAFADGRAVTLNTFVETLVPKGAEVLARWGGGDTLLAGAAAITRHRVGKGSVVYIGGYCLEAGVNSLVDYFMRSEGLVAVAEATKDVETVLRRSGRRQWLVLMNHTGGTQAVYGVAEGKDLLSGKRVENASVTLPGYGVAIVETGA